MVAAVHAHIDLGLVLRKILAERLLIVAMPCCMPLSIGGIEPVEEYEDGGCWSPHRTVRVYDIRRQA